MSDKKQFFLSQYSKKPVRINTKACRSFDMITEKNSLLIKKDQSFHKSTNQVDVIKVKQQKQQLQKQIHTFTEGIQLQKAKISQLNDDNKTLQKYIMKMESNNNETTLTSLISVKNAYKDKDEELRKIKEELCNMKKDKRVTKITEAKILNQNLFQENQRLSVGFSLETSKTSQHEFPYQLPEDIGKLQKTIEIQKETIQKLQLSLKNQKSHSGQLQRVIDSMTQLERSHLKNRCLKDYQQTIEQKDQNITKLRSIIKQLEFTIKENNEQKEVFKAKIEKLGALPDHLADLSMRYQDICQEKLELQTQLDDQIQEIQLLKQCQPEKTVESPTFRKKSTTRSSYKETPKKEIMVKEINHEQVKSLCELLHYKLKLKKIGFDQIDYYFLEKYKYSIDIKEIQQVLSQQPFEIVNKEHSYMVAKYLIEQDEQRVNRVHYQDVRFVISVLKDLIKQYSFQNKTELNESLYLLGRQIHQNKYLIERICKKKAKERGVTEQTFLFRVLAHVDDFLDCLPYTMQQKDLIKEQLYRTTNYLNFFIFKNFLEYWIFVKQKLSKPLKRLRRIVQTQIFLKKIHEKGNSPEQMQESIVVFLFIKATKMFNIRQNNNKRDSIDITREYMLENKKEIESPSKMKMKFKEYSVVMSKLFILDKQDYDVRENQDSGEVQNLFLNQPQIEKKKFKLKFKSTN